MADLARIKRNVAKMASMNAPEEDIDGYIASEGVTIDDVRKYRPEASAPKVSRLPEDPVASEKARLDDYYSSGIYAGAYNPLGPVMRTLDAGAKGIARSPMFGWDDEIAAAASTLGGGDYTENQRKFDAQKQAVREQNPIASTVGELAGGLVTGGTVARTGATLAGRSLPLIGRTGGAALEGAGYGALVGAGEAKPGERMEGAGLGATVGAIVGAGASKVGDALASRAARKASSSTALSADELAAQAAPLYQQAYQSGVSIKPQSANRVIANMKFAAGRPNEKLRPQTMGIVEEIDALANKPMDIQTLHELRQTVDKALKVAQGPDEVPLNRMRHILNSFADNIGQNDLNGPKQAVEMFRKADDAWRRSTKAAKIEELFDLADVKSGQYTQSGMANAIKTKARELYTRIAKGQEKSFSAEEIVLIRQLSKGEMTPKVVSWLAKLAPRGVVSLGSGVGMGGAIGTMFGPAGTVIGAAVPGAIGFAAGRAADRAAVRGLSALQSAAASGNAPVLNAITNKTVPLIGGMSGAASSQVNRTR